MAINIAFSGEHSEQVFGVDDAPTSFSRRRLIATVAGIGALAITGLSGYNLWLKPRREMTAKGNVRIVPLDDGSTATLNTDSVISIAYNDKVRRIRLDRGEALFDVAKDRNRPFIVEANGVRIRAVGTSFAVRQSPDHSIGIIMREGIVDVLREADGAQVRMGADTSLQAIRGSNLAVRKVSPSAVSSALAWKDGQIDLNQMTIAQAISEFARYSDRKISIEGPDIGNLRMTGLYPANDPDGFAEAVALAFGLTAERASEGVVLRRR